MKLPRTLAAAAATAALAPLALLCAHPALAEETGSPSASASESESTSASPSDSESSGASASASDTTSPSASDSQSQSATGSASASASGSQSASSSSSASSSASASESPFDPVTDCTSMDWTDDISATITGLPSKIVAGSGWHDFKYVVENYSDADLKNVYMATLMEYDDDTDAFLSDGLAAIQVKEDGKWTSAYQDSWDDGEGGSVNISSSFVALLDELKQGDSATFDLRVKVKASAPAGSSIALSEAVYAGKDGGCNVTGDVYDVTILAAGSDAGDPGDAKPNGDKPTGGPKPQGDAKPISGSLASTGSDSSLPMIGLIGGVTVVAGAGAVFAARRRKTGAHA